MCLVSDSKNQYNELQINFKFQNAKPATSSSCDFFVRQIPNKQLVFEKNEPDTIESMLNQ